MVCAMNWCLLGPLIISAYNDKSRDHDLLLDLRLLNNTRTEVMAIDLGSFSAYYEWILYSHYLNLFLYLMI